MNLVLLTAISALVSVGAQQEREGLFAWITPDSWRRATKEEAFVKEKLDVRDNNQDSKLSEAAGQAQERFEESKDSIKERASAVKESAIDYTKHATQKAKYHIRSYSQLGTLHRNTCLNH